MVALVAVVDQLAVAFRFARHVVIEDQTILWYAARDWGAGTVHAPNYPGQTYGSTFEAIPTEVLRWFGVGPNTALPVVLTLLGLAPWLLLGWVLVRRGRTVAALSAVAAPILLSTYYAQYVSFYGAGAGRFLAGVAAVLVIGAPTSRTAFAVACGVGAFGAAIDPSALLLVAPVLAYGFLGAPKVERAVAALLGVVPTGGWLLYVHHFYSVHPDDDLHPAPAILQLDTFGRTIGHPSRYWQMFAPELARSWMVPLAVAVGLVGVLVTTRRRQYVVPALLVTAFVLLELSSDRATQGSSPLLPYARVFLVVPMTLWFLAYLVVESGVVRRWRYPYRVLALGLAVLGLASVAVRQVTLTERNDALVTAAARARFVFPVVRADDLEARCRRLASLAHRTDIALAVLVIDRASAYGCGAASYGTVRTLFPEYERRTWLLHDEAHRRRRRMLVIGVDGAWCGAVGARVSSCREVPLTTPVQGFAAVVTFPRASAIAVLRRVGLTVRPFGRGCHPRQPRSCS